MVQAQHPKDSVSFAIAIIIGIALAVTGVTAIIAPGFASAIFGVAAAEHSARVYFFATGLRDIAIGCWLIVLAVMGAGSRILGASLIVLALIPVGDALIVGMNAAELSAIALTLHILSAIVFLALGFWLRAGLNRD